MSVARVDRNSAPVRNFAIILDRPEFDRIKLILANDAGIALTDDKINLVHARLQKRLREIGIPSFNVYCDYVEAPEGVQERREMLNSLTTNLTRFFREPHHFKHLVQQSLPTLITKAKAGERVRIWSAGCSSGQEPYSIAASVLAVCPNATNYDIKILASDIDQNVLQTARNGRYEANIIKHMPDKLRAKFFERFDGPGSDTYVASENVKSLIAFNELNLNASHWPMRGKFDIIFCRNTVIYFNESDQAKMWSRFAKQLNNNGYLYIGHSERLSGPDVKNFIKSSTTTYQYQP